LFLQRRSIRCEGFLRDDGLIDIDAFLEDVRGAETSNEWRGRLAPGEPLHLMQLRVTLDAQLTIRAIESTTEAAPYPTCPDVVPAMQRLVGVAIISGFRRELHARIGGTDGCTHVRALLEAVGAAALQAFAAQRRHQQGRFTIRDAEGLDPKRPSMLDSCRGYAADGPVAARFWPDDPRVRAAHDEEDAE
jgi:hypothetical protein